MDKLAKLITDIGKLWANYSGAYFTGIQNTLILAVAATLAGCLIGLLCGVLNTIPFTKYDHPAKRFFLKLLRGLIRVYVEVFRGTPMRIWISILRGLAWSRCRLRLIRSRRRRFRRPLKA